ncbi:MAG: zinc-ribbon domain-containing protein [Roseobacter sp.]
MRLICPNCDAQYEVPDDIMPLDGRDVQCSNCGQTWFQAHPDAVVAEEDTLDAPLEDEEIIRPDTTSDAPAPVDAPEPEPTLDVPTFEPETPQPEPAAPTRRELDPTVAEVLKAEAELEAQARQQETAVMESQPDLGLDEVPDESLKRAKEARDRMARMRGEQVQDYETEDSVPAAAASVLGSRRDLLPDIEEINSTLRSNNDRSAGTDPGQTAQLEVQEKRSSRRGFILVIALASMLALVYTYAPQIAEAIPQTDPALSAYVTMVDGWRVWLDTKVSSLLSWLDAAAVSSSQ